MSTVCVLPKIENTSKILNGLLGGALTVKEAAAPFAEMPAAVGSYVTDDGETAALFVCDLPFACNVGAALAMIPKSVAEDSIKLGTVDEDLLENLREVLNIAARLFNYAGVGVHVALRQVVVAGSSVPQDIIALYKSPHMRVDYDADIEGYGPGRFVLLTA